MNLLIVESPAKAKTLQKYLGSDFSILASVGHIRDLPSKTGSVLPDEDFLMKYEISEKAIKNVDQIVRAAKSASKIYLATDPDREGEAISWHILEVMKERGVLKDFANVKRVAFNEITKKAVLNAVAHPRDIDLNLVNAQQARRALDYLVGFTLSPILWRKLPGCKSAGRVQSVALRIVCDREQEIEKFKTREYWDITLKMLNKDQLPITAKLTHVDSEKLEKFSINNESQAKLIADAVSVQTFSIANVEKKQQKRMPPAPFITSSLQQEAARKLGFSAKKTMQIAQKLYEGVEVSGDTIGLITYMRTDGVTLSADSVQQIRTVLLKMFGEKYLPSSPRIYKSKAKNAQEAHEAIRPTDASLTPDALKTKLDKDFYSLYDLIWKRTMACQMENAVLDLVNVSFESSTPRAFVAKATGSNIAFDGFYKLYREGTDDDAEEEDNLLPILNIGEGVNIQDVLPAQHFTEPPPRYSEASLVKKLEELGIGRPSTYAAILSVLQERKYVRIDKKRFIPEELGRLVTTFLLGFFRQYVEYDFTADLETELDQVSDGQKIWKDLLKEFWDGFNKNIAAVSEQKITDVIAYIEKELDHHLFGEDLSSKECKACGTGKLSLKLGKFGAFLACSNYPECTFKKQIAGNLDQQDNPIADAENSTRILGQSQDGNDIYLKKGPYGWYVQKGEAQSKKDKPQRVTLQSNMDPSSLTLETALKLLSLPYKICVYPDTKEDILLGIGRFGPYLKYGSKFASISRKIDPFSVGPEQAIEIVSAHIKKKSG